MPGPDAQELERTVRSFSGRRIAVLGDLMLDEYWLGEASRLSPEAPVAVVGVRTISHRAGGAASVAMNARALDGRVSLTGIVGDDAEGRILCELLNDASVDATSVHRSASRVTTRKTRVIARQQQIVRVDREQTHVASETEAEALTRATAQLLSQADVLVVSDYSKGVVSPKVARAVIEKARALSIQVIVDPKGEDYGKYHGASVLTPNVAELGRAVDRQLLGDQEIEAAARELIHELELEAVLVTRSEEGMKLVRRDEPVFDIATSALEVFDVTGAGDTVVATLALGMAAGASLAASAVLANVAAGISVSRRGTATVSQPELIERLRQRAFSPT